MRLDAHASSPVRRAKLSAALVGAFATTAVFADWVKIDRAADTGPETFIDVKAIRQTGPMNTMRRVWQLNNLAKPSNLQALSIKTQFEYDCKDRRIRVIEESYFPEHWARGERLPDGVPSDRPSEWSAITSGSLGETIFKRVCPSDES
jgi:hypothetical protein